MVTWKNALLREIVPLAVGLPDSPPDEVIENANGVVDSDSGGVFPPVNEKRPKIVPPAGWPLTYDQTATINVGTWLGSPTSYAYQWYMDGEDVPGATASSLYITNDMIGKLPSARVTATNAAGSTERYTPVGDAIVGRTFIVDVSSLATGADLNGLTGVNRQSPFVGTMTKRADGNIDANSTDAFGITYRIQRIGTEGHYIEATILPSGAAAEGPGLLVWVTDANNWLGVFWSTTAGSPGYSLWVRSAGTMIKIAGKESYGVVPQSGDFVRLEVSADGVASLFVNGSEIGAKVSVEHIAPSQFAGMVSKAVARQPFVANLVRCGPLA